MSFVHISGWVEVTQPSGPSGPVDPSWGTRPPVDPGWGINAGLRPDNSLPWAPAHPGNKPPGRPILPPHADNGLPPSQPPHIWGGGRWEILDPGWGKPPIFGIIPPDPGYGIPEGGPPHVPGQPLPAPPGGQWVPTDPDYGIPEHGCGGGKPKPPIWAWVPNPPDLAKPIPPTGPQPK